MKLILLFVSFVFAADPILPDSILTPGDTVSIPLCTLCTPGYTAKIRNVPLSLKKQVYKEYNIQQTVPRQYEVDHLISLELGGSNNIKNLWPQSYLTTPWNAHVKDRLEDRLHSLVCKQQITLQEAQCEISHNWILAFKKYFPTDSLSK